MNNKLYFTYLLLLYFIVTLGASAQPKQQFRVESFGLDQFDMTARNESFKEVDGNGSLYAIIKVTSSTPNDDLSAYNFNFGNMNSKVKMKDGELWVYVQRNAKMVTISRNGYETINKYDLQTTIEEGRTYTMRLSTQVKKMQLQMVLFKVSPANCNAVIMVKAETGNQQKQTLGMVDASGQKARNLEYGCYTYEVFAENYYSSEGQFTLSDQSKTHIETVELRPQFSEITLTVDSDADIYVNNELKGQRTWKGPLNAGTYQVECRQQNHKPTLQTIVVEENKPQTITLQAPTPITGILSVISEPLGATITIDGKNYGQTPRNISDLLIGRHQVKLSMTGYEDLTQTVEIQENNLTETSLVMNQQPETPSNPDEQTFTVTGNGKTITFKMKKVEAGSFQRGSDSGDNDEKPVHQVTLSKDYYMGETEVTQALWYAVMGQSPTSDGYKWESKYGYGDNYPAYYISYEDCQKFIRKLNEKTGQKFRMPTDAEWEFAAKGGNQSKGYTYAGSNNIEDVAWYYGNSGSQLLDDSKWEYDNLSKYNCKTHPVARKQANELGLYDMSGNVCEWCYDWEVRHWWHYYSAFALTDPKGPSSGSYRLNRGGGWRFPAKCCRSAYPYFRDTPIDRCNWLGFRLAL